MEKVKIEVEKKDDTSKFSRLKGYAEKMRKMTEEKEKKDGV